MEHHGAEGTQGDWDFMRIILPELNIVPSPPSRIGKDKQRGTNLNGWPIIYKSWLLNDPLQSRGEEGPEMTGVGSITNFEPHIKMISSSCGKYLTKL